VPSEARKRGSGGGSLRKRDDLLTGASDLRSEMRVEIKVINNMITTFEHEQKGIPRRSNI
jgi:hypothetical protein